MKVNAFPMLRRVAVAALPVHDVELPVTLPVTVPPFSVTPPILFDEAVGVIKLLDWVVLLLLIVVTPVIVPPTLRVVPFHVNVLFAFTLVAFIPDVITWLATVYPFTASAP